MNNETVGSRIRELRLKRGMTTTELAGRVGISHPQVSRLENGRQNFRTQTLARIAAALGVKPDHFFMEEEARGVAEASAPYGLVAGGNLRAAMKSRVFFRAVERLAHVFFDEKEAFMVINASVKAIRGVRQAGRSS